jgi:hypothetical protein
MKIWYLGISVEFKTQAQSKALNVNEKWTDVNEKWTDVNEKWTDVNEKWTDVNEKWTDVNRHRDTSPDHSAWQD